MSGLSTEVIYHIRGAVMFSGWGYSPDGRGVYWYDTYSEAAEEHGNLPVAVVTGDELDEMRR